MSLLLLAVLLLGLAVAAVLGARSYTPAPELGWLRGLATALAASAVVVLTVSIQTTWWVQSNVEDEDPVEEPSRGDSGVALTIVVSGVITATASAAGAWGRRNWAPLGLPVMWIALGYGWLIAAGGAWSSRVYGEPRSGVRLGTLAAGLVTLAAVTAIVHRSLSVRSARATR